jgi:putative endonuclease
MKAPAVYIMASEKNGTLYTGVTSGLAVRVHQHKTGQGSAFTKKYGCKMLVYYEFYDTMIGAIEREKKIKASSRTKKLALIESMNPQWNDLYDSLV